MILRDMTVKDTIGKDMINKATINKDAIVNTKIKMAILALRSLMYRVL
jgi:hypothetical protein